jgi:hypothetical protein
MSAMARIEELPEATLKDTFDHIPLVLTVLVLANVAAAAAIGRGTYNLVRRVREPKPWNRDAVARAAALRSIH